MSEVMQRLQVQILIILCLFLFTFQMGNYPFLDGDATFYGQISKNMIEHGDWITLRFDHNDPTYFVDKPPLTMWVTAVLFKIFGTNEYVARSWHNLLAVFCVWLTYLIGLRLFKHQIALLAGFIMATSLQFFYQAREPLQDIPLLAFFLLSFYFFLLLLKHKKFGYVHLIALFTGLAVMTKGPVGLLIPGLVMFIYFIAGKEYENFKLKEYLVHLPLALLVFLLVTLPWHIAEYLKEGPTFLNFYFGERTLVRYLGTGSFPGSALPSYLGYLVAGFLPWTIFLFQALIAAVKQIKSRLADDEVNGVLFLVIWLVVVFCFFALSPGRIFMRYLLPLFPAVALLIAKYLHESVNSSFTWAGISALFTGIIISLLTVFLNYIPAFPSVIPNKYVYLSVLNPLLLGLSSGLLLCAYFIFRKEARKAIYLLICFISMSYLIFTVALVKNTPVLLPEKQVAQYINITFPANMPSAKYMPAGGGVTMLSFYLKPYLKCLRNEAELQEFLSNNGQAVVIIEKETVLPGNTNMALVNDISGWKVYRK